MDQFRLGQRKGLVFIDQEVAVRRGDINGSRLQAIPIFGLLNLKGGAPAENVGHQAAVSGVQVLDHHHDRRKAGR